MVVPIVAGGALLTFIAWGEDIFGKNTFNKIIKGTIIVGIVIVIYIVYKLYRTWMDTREKAEDVYEGVSEKVTKTYEDILGLLNQAGERGKESYGWITTVTPEEFLPDVDKAAGKITPGDYESTYGPDEIAGSSLLRKIYWTPTAIILGTKERVTGEAKDIHRDITTIPPRLKTQLTEDISKLEKAKKDLLNAPSYYAEKLKFW